MDTFSRAPIKEEEATVLAAVEVEKFVTSAIQLQSLQACDEHLYSTLSRSSGMFKNDRVWTISGTVKRYWQVRSSLTLN